MELSEDFLMHFAETTFCIYPLFQPALLTKTNKSELNKHFRKILNTTITYLTYIFRLISGTFDESSFNVSDFSEKKCFGYFSHGHDFRTCLNLERKFKLLTWTLHLFYMHLKFGLGYFLYLFSCLPFLDYFFFFFLNKYHWFSMTI